MVSSRVIIAGLIASMVMGMMEMVYEALAGAGFWSPPVFIAATVLRDVQQVATPVPFLLFPVILGLMGHMMNSVILGVGFASLAPRLDRLGVLAVGGSLYGLLVFAAMWFAVLLVVDPVMLHLNGFVFATAHVVWGSVLALVMGWREFPGMPTRRAPAH